MCSVTTERPIRDACLSQTKGYSLQSRLKEKLRQEDSLNHGVQGQPRQCSETLSQKNKQEANEQQQTNKNPKNQKQTTQKTKQTKRIFQAYLCVADPMLGVGLGILWSSACLVFTDPWVQHP